MEREKDGIGRAGRCKTEQGGAGRGSDRAGQGRTGQGGQSDYRRKGRLYFDTNSANASSSVCKVRKQN
jgi:hypothetical protein